MTRLQMPFVIDAASPPRKGRQDMRVRSFSSIAATAVLAASTGLVAAFPAVAADLPAPPKVIYEPEPPIAIGSGWYLRGDIGISHQGLKSVTNEFFDNRDITNGNTIDWPKQEFDPAGIIGVGIGYQFNSWLRGDITGEYRTKSNFRGVDHVRNANGQTVVVNDFHGSKTEWLALANLYLDLGTWGGFTPYIGAGIGFANVRMGKLWDFNVTPPGLPAGLGRGQIGVSRAGSKTNFAWALHAGTAYWVNDAFAIDMSYRYLNLGTGSQGAPPVALATGTTISTPWRFNRIHSHDLRVGLRWMLDAPARTAYHAPAPRVVKY